MEAGEGAGAEEVAGVDAAGGEELKVIAMHGGGLLARSLPSTQVDHKRSGHEGEEAINGLAPASIAT